MKLSALLLVFAFMSFTAGNPCPSKVSKVDMANGIKEALENGVTKEVSKLTKMDGFYKNNLVKILWPSEIKKVDKALRELGMNSLADEGVKMLNRAAEDAVKEATPVFVSAIKGLSFTDAKNILMGNDSAATSYLKKTTNSQLYQKFLPVVKNSFTKVSADKVWKTIVSKYNAIPFVTKVNPDLNDYVTNQALRGVYKMIAIEEKEIRNNLNARTSDLLKNVFSLQDEIVPKIKLK